MMLHVTTLLAREYFLVEIPQLQQLMHEQQI